MPMNLSILQEHCHYIDLSSFFALTNRQFSSNWLSLKCYTNSAVQQILITKQTNLKQNKTKIKFSASHLVGIKGKLM